MKNIFFSIIAGMGNQSMIILFSYIPLAGIPEKFCGHRITEGDDCPFIKPDDTVIGRKKDRFDLVLGLLKLTRTIKDPLADTLIFANAGEHEDEEHQAEADACG